MGCPPPQIWGDRPPQSPEVSAHGSGSRDLEEQWRSYRQLCARGRAMKLEPPATSLFFQISKFSFEILEYRC